jgi:hypothetical protein
MTTGARPPVRVEVLARKDCDNRGMAVLVVERVAAEMGIPVALEVIDVASVAQARKRRFLGSPSVRVDGLDVEPGTNGSTDFTLGDRVYRSGERGLQGWPDERWIRAALVVARAAANGNGGSPSARSSATSP